MANEYKDDSIESLSPLEHVRLRPGMYAGDTSDATQLAIEILGNAIDEYNIGHGSLISISLCEDGQVIISDTGQGFPINVFREDGETVLQASFDVINTSGKYRDDGVYEGTAIGLNGIGAKLTNFLSHKLIVTSFNNKQEYEEITFIEGVFKERKTGKVDAHDSGTIVCFIPSEEFFDSPRVNEKKLRDFCEDITCLCPGLTIKFNGEDISHSGIGDLLARRLGKDESLLGDFLLFQKEQGKQKISAAATYCGRSSSNITAYVNCGLTTAGPHLTSIKSTITRILNKWAREQGLLKEKDKNLEGFALQEGLVFVCNITAENVAYDAQIKSTITKIDTSFISSSLGEQLEIWLDNNPTDGQIIIERALVARKAAEAAKKARERVKTAETKKTVTKLAVMPSKLADCHSKDRKKCELYITEGDSASGGAKTIRDASYQAIMGLRGKILNALTAQQTTIHKNQEIMNIIQALGLSWNSKGDKVLYNKEKLRYGKVIIAADRDSDGSHIQSLVLTMFWTLIPDLILDGYVYIALPPLYKAEWGKQYKYLDDKKALEDFRKTHSGAFTLTYFKGLGEASPQELGAMIMDPATRNIQQVVVEDIGLTDKTINNLMGKNSMPKKEFVFGNKITEVM